MADDASSTQSYERRGGPGRGGRGGASRGEGGRGDGARGEAGGFRIRLSDNEMQAARALQEAFGLRSTVAVLGFCLRSLAQLLEQGKLDELIQQQRAQAASRPPGAGRDGERRGGRGEAGGGGGGGRPKADPFARPSRPAAALAEEPEQDTPPVDASDLVSDHAADLDAPEAADTATSPEAEGLATPDNAAEPLGADAAAAGLANDSSQA